MEIRKRKAIARVIGEVETAADVEAYVTALAIFMSKQEGVVWIPTEYTPPYVDEDGERVLEMHLIRGEDALMATILGMVEEAEE